MTMAHGSLWYRQTLFFVHFYKISKYNLYYSPIELLKSWSASWNSEIIVLIFFSFLFTKTCSIVTLSQTPTQWFNWAKRMQKCIVLEDIEKVMQEILYVCRSALLTSECAIYTKLICCNLWFPNPPLWSIDFKFPWYWKFLNTFSFSW